MGAVVNMRGVKTSAKTQPRRRKKRAKRSLDPRRSVEGRVFEIILEQSEGSDGFAHRFRVRLLAKGGLEENVRRFAGNDCLVGMAREQVGVNKWSDEGYAVIPIGDTVSIREIVERPKPLAPVKVQH